jgi:CDP-diacylglycerol--glycerol-3-phosphate 3-phosphatidyltransferase
VLGVFRVTLYALKPRFQALLRPLVFRLADMGITANQVTLAAAIGSMLVGALIVVLVPRDWPFLLLPVWLLLRMALNAVDGMLARDFGQKSQLGGYLNEIADVVSDAALYAPFGWLVPFGPFWTGLVIVLAVISEFAGVLGSSVGASRRYEGPMGKSDRALAFGALGLWVGIGGPLPNWGPLIMAAIAILLTLTIVNRVRAGLAEGRNAP